VKKNGFSLIELLVVVAIASVFAIFALITINPLEQVKKARDTGKLSRAQKAISAAERYFIFQNKDPADCDALIAVDALKLGSCDGITLNIISAGNYTITFMAESKGNQDKCGGATCTFPDDF